MEKIIQIQCMNQNDHAEAALWCLTEDGKIYFLILREGTWYEQSLPTGDVKIQENRK